MPQTVCIMVFTGVSRWPVKQHRSARGKFSVRLGRDIHRHVNHLSQFELAQANGKIKTAKTAVTLRLFKWNKFLIGF